MQPVTGNGYVPTCIQNILNGTKNNLQSINRNQRLYLYKCQLMSVSTVDASVILSKYQKQQVPCWFGWDFLTLLIIRGNLIGKVLRMRSQKTNSTWQRMRVTDSDTSLLLVGWGRVWTFLLQPSTADGDSPYLSEIFLSIFSLHINKILALSTFPFHAFPDSLIYCL